MQKRMLGGLLVLCLGLAGCGGDEIRVTGTVKQTDGTPLSGALVTFYPASQTTPGLGGSGQTGAGGQYVITGNRGEKGLAPGEYTITISRRLRPDGSPPDPNVPPIES